MHEIQLYGEGMAISSVVGERDAKKNQAWVLFLNAVALIDLVVFLVIINQERKIEG